MAAGTPAPNVVGHPGPCHQGAAARADIGGIGVKRHLAAGHQTFQTVHLGLVAGADRNLMDEPVLVHVDKAVIAPDRLHPTRHADLHTGTRLGIGSADPARRRLHDRSVHNGNAALGEDHTGALRRAVDLGQQRLHPVAQPGAEPPQRGVIRHALIQFQPAELAEQQIACQLRRQSDVRQIIPKPQKQRPEQRQRRIARPARRPTILALRQERLQSRPVQQGLDPVQSRKGRMIQQVLRGKNGGLGAETLAHGKDDDIQPQSGIHDAFRRGLFKETGFGGCAFIGRPCFPNGACRFRLRRITRARWPRTAVRPHLRSACLR